MLTVSPSFVSSGLASAVGNVRSIPPCIIGAVIMKITSRSNITSIKLTTLMSAFSSKRSRRRRRAISEQSLAHEQRNEHAAEALHLPVEPIETTREDVVAERRGNRHCERRRRRRQRLADTGSDSGKIPRSLGRNAQERLDDAEHCAQKSDERTD